MGHALAPLNFAYVTRHNANITCAGHITYIAYIITLMLILKDVHYYSLFIHYINLNAELMLK